MKKRNFKQIGAIIGIVLLVALSIATLLAAIFDKSGRLFQAFLVATIATPILLWIYIWLYGIMTNKKTMASFHEEEAAEAKMTEEEATEEDSESEDDK